MTLRDSSSFDKIAYLRPKQCRVDQVITDKINIGGWRTPDVLDRGPELWIQYAPNLVGMYLVRYI